MFFLNCSCTVGLNFSIFDSFLHIDWCLMLSPLGYIFYPASLLRQMISLFTIYSFFLRVRLQLFIHLSCILLLYRTAIVNFSKNFLDCSCRFKFFYSNSFMQIDHCLVLSPLFYAASFLRQVISLSTIDLFFLGVRLYWK